MSLITIHSNTKGNRVLKVYGKLNHNSQTHYEAELFVDGVSKGLEAITTGQVKTRYPVFVSGALSKTVRI